MAYLYNQLGLTIVFCPAVEKKRIRGTPDAAHLIGENLKI